MVGVLCAFVTASFSQRIHSLEYNFIVVLDSYEYASSMHVQLKHLYKVIHNILFPRDLGNSSQ